jgi:hypothetical protein
MGLSASRTAGLIVVAVAPVSMSARFVDGGPPHGVANSNVEFYIGLHSVETAAEFNRVRRHQDTTWPISRTGSSSTIF